MEPHTLPGLQDKAARCPESYSCHFYQWQYMALGTCPGTEARELVLTPCQPLLLRKLSGKNLPFWVSVSLCESEGIGFSELDSEPALLASGQGHGLGGGMVGTAAVCHFPRARLLFDCSMDLHGEPGLGFACAVRVHVCI